MQAKEFGRTLNKNQQMILFTNDGESSTVTAILNKHTKVPTMDAAICIAITERIAQDEEFAKSMIDWLKTHRPNMFPQGAKK